MRKLVNQLSNKNSTDQPVDSEVAQPVDLLTIMKLD